MESTDSLLSKFTSEKFTFQQNQATNLPPSPKASSTHHVHTDNPSTPHPSPHLKSPPPHTHTHTGA